MLSLVGCDYVIEKRCCVFEITTKLTPVWIQQQRYQRCFYLINKKRWRLDDSEYFCHAKQQLHYSRKENVAFSTPNIVTLWSPTDGITIRRIMPFRGRMNESTMT